VVPVFSPMTWLCAASLAIAAFLWMEGRHQIQFQRPVGIVSGEALVLLGIYLLAQFGVFRANALGAANRVALASGVAAIVAGGVLTSVVVRGFVKSFERHRILERLNQQGEVILPEYGPPTRECPHPGRWKMTDSQSTELEVLEFLKHVVTTVKPELILETGTFIGSGAIGMAEGLKENGFGRIVTLENDPLVFAKAKERIEVSGLSDWIECRNESSLDAKIEGSIDLYFCDSLLSVREQEIRKFLPQINPQGLILVHDASSHFAVVRDAVFRLEAEGLISTVLLSTPRGLAVAQKRAGRK
jgi:predicted O-methyltransferase YrrM